MARSTRGQAHPKDELGPLHRRDRRLRFSAIAMVVLFHSQLRVFEASGGEIGEAPPPHNVFDLSIAQGRFGAHLFFIISGFVLALPFAMERLAGARPVRLKAFYLQRPRSGPSVRLPAPSCSTS